MFYGSLIQKYFRIFPRHFLTSGSYEFASLNVRFLAEITADKLLLAQPSYHSQSVHYMDASRRNVTKCNEM